MRKKVDGVIAIWAMVLIIIFGCRNVKGLGQQLLQVRGHWNDENLVEQLSTIESSYRTEFSGKAGFINLYGVVQHPLHKKIFDNFNFVVDDQEVFHATAPNGCDATNFANEMAEINKMLQSRGIPLIYVQSPNKEYYNTEAGIEEFSHENEMIDNAVAKIRQTGVEVLDMREVIDAKYPGNKQEIFFKTDIHMQTDAELWLANELENYLSENHDLEFQNQEYLTDMSYYEKDTRELRGNLIRNVGEYYQKPDQFDMYYPKFDTDLEVYGYPNENYGVGTFQQIVMRGYETQEDNGTTYWITNYGYYGMPRYDVINRLNPNGAKILVVADSMGFRTFSYMINTIGKITMVDTRFFDGGDYLTDLINEGGYDAVIVYQGNSLIPYSFNVQR